MAAVAGARAASATLTAATVDTVTLSRAAGGSACEIINRGPDAIWFRSDGVDPVAEAAECEIVLPSERLSTGAGRSGVVKLISTGASKYTVVATS